MAKPRRSSPPIDHEAETKAKELARVNSADRKKLIASPEFKQRTAERVERLRKQTESFFRQTQELLHPTFGPAISEPNGVLELIRRLESSNQAASKPSAPAGVAAMTPPPVEQPPLAPPEHPPWNDGDLRHLQPLPRKLLRFLWVPRFAHLSNVCPAVWDEPWNTISKNQIKAAVRRANRFLTDFRYTYNIRVDGEFLYLD